MMNNTRLASVGRPNSSDARLPTIIGVVDMPCEMTNMLPTFSAFNDSSSSSWLSGGRRVVVENGLFSTKGLWQQFKMSFISKADRKDANKGTIDEFRKALNVEYGKTLLESVEKRDKMLTSKHTNGAKLLTRDVHRFIKLCNQARAKIGVSS